MKQRILWRCVTLLVLAGLLTVPPSGAQAPSRAPPNPRPAPKLEAVAETRLLMDGLAQANYRGLQRLLKERPADVETWTFARGQALLLAETGNLLMLRPPHNPGEKVWMQQATDLRESATVLARQLAGRDYQRSRAALAAVTTACNRCHQTFRIPARIGPEVPAGDRGAGRNTE